MNVISWRSLASRARAVFRKQRLDQELDDELRFHLEMSAAEHQRRGLSLDEARHVARRELGGLEQVKDAYRDQRGWPLVDSALQDLRYGLRSLLRSPGFTGIAVLTLAVGIGGCVTVFSIVNGIYLNPLPYEAPHELIAVESTRDGESGNVSLRDVDDWTKASSRLQDIGAYGGAHLNLIRRERPERIGGAFVTANLFSILGVVPVHGRDFVDEDRLLGSAPVVILADSFWRNRFGADPSVVGSQLTLDGVQHTVVGIMPPTFALLRLRPDVFTPYRHGHDDRSMRVAHALGRLCPSVGIEKARQELAGIAEALARAHPEINAGWGIRVRPLRDVVAPSRDIEAGIPIGFAAVGLILLIACSNVANLLLARAHARSRELAVRVAIGAGRRRLIRGLLTESSLMALAGGVLGLGLAHAGVGAMILTSPVQNLQIFDSRVDGKVLLFALVLSAITTFLFGLIPAVHCTSTDLTQSLKAGGVGVSRRGNRWGRALVVGEVALAFTLLTAAFVVMEALDSLHRREPGFNPENILTMRMTPPETKYRDADAVDRFYESILERIGSLPGVSSVGTTNNLTMAGADKRGPITVGDLRYIDELETRRVSLRSISPDYFATLSVPIVAGRGFNDMDRGASSLVAIVNETWARRFLPEGSPLGMNLVVWDGRAREIVGVVRDFYEVRLDRPIRPVVYLPAQQTDVRTRSFAVQVESEPEEMASSIQKAIWRIDPEQPVYSVHPMRVLVERQAWVLKRMVTMMVVFATIALAMGAAGIYGVTAYGTSQRTSEVGLRMALGASRKDVLSMFLKAGVARTLVGIAVGLPFSILLTGAMASVMLGVSRANAFACLNISLLLIAATVLACFIPANRASKAGTMTTLRCE